jgi:hypothetical protein
MISYADVYPLLVAACPSYPDSIHAADADANDGEYVRVSRFVEHLVALLADDETECLPAIFGIVEWVLTDGDEEARGLISLGFLDDLTDLDPQGHVAGHRADLLRWLGPVTQQDPTVQHLLGARGLRPDVGSAGGGPHQGNPPPEHEGTEDQ